MILRLTPVFAALTLFLSTLSAFAQWVREDYPLVAGWNAIWLPHDVSHEEIGDLVPAAVEEVWRWNVNSSPTQFVNSPALPVQQDTQWLVWKNGFPTQSTMSTFVANSAYLIKVADGSANFTLSLLGQPVPPNYNWASSGLNFFGFPMQTPDDVASRNFETFLSYSAELSAGPDIFKYDGGPLANNPVQVAAPLFEPVSRGKAYWIRSSQFTDYYGPLRVTISGGGFAYGEAGSLLAMRVQNVTEGSVDVTLTPADSVAPPAGQTPSAGSVPQRLRGAFNAVLGQHDYVDFDAPIVRTLAAGAIEEFVFAVDRAAMGGSPGDVFQSIIQLTDSLNISRINLPVSATAASRSGLWVGAAMVATVDQITAAPDPQPDGTANVIVNTDADASTPALFPIRLILHRADDGTVKLLQRVYIGEGQADAPVVATEESFLNQQALASARRFSSSAFPLGAKVIKTGDDLGLSGTSSFNVVVGHTEASNPFLHTYHPDHDNKSAEFTPIQLADGIESYTVSRSIGLSFLSDPSSLGVTNLGWGSTVLGGDYEETLTGLRAQPITVKGKFVINRISPIETLTE